MGDASAAAYTRWQTNYPDDLALGSVKRFRRLIRSGSEETIFLSDDDRLKHDAGTIISSILRTTWS
jgi:hypothetical protein